MEFLLDSEDVQLVKYLIKKSGIVYKDDITVKEALKATDELFYDGITWGKILVLLVLANNMHTRNRTSFTTSVTKLYDARLKPWIILKGGFMNCAFKEKPSSNKNTIIAVVLCHVISLIIIKLF